MPLSLSRTLYPTPNSLAHIPEPHPRASQLPAGLIDGREGAAAAALRELREETGYSGGVATVSPVCYSDPGMTNANMQFVEVDVDADSEANASVDPQLEVRPLGFRVQGCKKIG